MIYTILRSRLRFIIGIAAGLLAGAVLPLGTGRFVAAWDIGATVFLALTAYAMAKTGPGGMPEDAAAQQQGEWVIFFLTLLGIIVSVFVIIIEFAGAKGLDDAHRATRMIAVVFTLLVSWLTVHTLFALRYAHEYYTRENDDLQKGLNFPGGGQPDYFDFVYFSLVLGMTFQVSDVEITDRHLRRLATIQGLISFLFNTILVAFTVNLAAGLL